VKCYSGISVRLWILSYPSVYLGGYYAHARCTTSDEVKKYQHLSDGPCSGANLLAPAISEIGCRHSAGVGAGPSFPDDLERRFDPPTARGLPSRPLPR
jgi:hypothetical protein